MKTLSRFLPCPNASRAVEFRLPRFGKRGRGGHSTPGRGLPNPREGAIHDLKTMSGSWPAAGIAAIRLNSDIVTAPLVNGQPRRVKLHLSEPGGRYNGAVLLFSTDTGQLLVMAPDGIMQRARVGATSGVATKYLAREDVEVLGLLGTGFQAGGQLKPSRPCGASSTLKVFSPNVENRRRFVEHYRKRLDLDIREGASAEETVDGVDVLVTATNSVSPTIKPEWLKPGMHLSSINRTELAPAVFTKVDRLIVNAREGGKSFTARNTPDLGGFNKGDRNAHSGIADVASVPELKDMVSGKARGGNHVTKLPASTIIRGWGCNSPLSAASSIAKRKSGRSGSFSRTATSRRMCILKAGPFRDASRAASSRSG